MRGRLVAIDPGTKLSGFASFENGRFVTAGVVRWGHGDRVQRARAMGRALYACVGVADAVVCEHMQHYKNDRKSQPNDLIAVELAGGILIQSVAHPSAQVLHPSARTWKGTVPKPIHNERIKAKFPEAVDLLNATVPTGQHNHIWDAIGLGAWALDRLGNKD